MAFNPLQSFLGGQAAGQQQVDRQAQLIRDEEQDKYNKMKRFNDLSEDRKKAYFDDMVIGKSLLDAGDMAGFGEFQTNRLEHLKRLKSNDTTGTEMIIDTFNKGDIPTLLKGYEQGINAGRQLGYIKDTDNNGIQSSKILDDGTIIEVMRGGGRQVLSPEGKVLSGEDARAQIASSTRKEIEHKRELKNLETDAAMAKERAKGQVEREGNDIMLGVEAAQTVPILLRADKLLDLVDTGKPQAAMAWAKQQLGIETGDQAELNNLLGKQIIKQLKPTFGAQFTVNEGEWLKSMEADWGRSTEANRRLIRQGLDLAKERARIGKEAAQYSKDDRTMGVIDGYLNFKFDDRTAGQDQLNSVDLNNLSLEELKALRVKGG